MRRAIFILTAVLLMLSASVWANGEQEVVPERDSDGYLSVSADDMQVRWMVEGEDLSFEVDAPTTGWIAVGFDPTRVMKDANIVIGYVDGSSVVVKDQFGNGTFSHKSDTELGGTDDIIEASGSEQGGRTVIKFIIPIDSEDEYDTILTPGELHTVLIAYGPNGADNFTTKHAMRTKVSVRL
ncbi:MAG: DOMON domain-containing protein [Spirochaetota bacterium]|nr:DOMON domain-containing protein [Spirochaetota bacterium]